MSIHEKNGVMTFLYTLCNGPASKSYGIEVAKLAGLPSSVTRRAQALLQKLESPQLSLGYSVDSQWLDQNTGPNTDDIKKLDELGQQVRAASIDKMTPLDALNKISEWQQNYF